MLIQKLLACISISFSLATLTHCKSTNQNADLEASKSPASSDNSLEAVQKFDDLVSDFYCAGKNGRAFKVKGDYGADKSRPVGTLNPAGRSPFTIYHYSCSKRAGFNKIDCFSPHSAAAIVETRNNKAIKVSFYAGISDSERSHPETLDGDSHTIDLDCQN